MFDIGFSEVLIIAVVALLVLGPERLPKAARFAGLWVRRARAQWYSVKAEFEREIAQEELMRQVREPFAEVMAETGAQMRALDAELSAVVAPEGIDNDIIAPAGFAYQDTASHATAPTDDQAPLQGDLLAPLDTAPSCAPHDSDPHGVARP